MLGVALTTCLHIPASSVSLWLCSMAALRHSSLARSPAELLLSEMASITRESMDKQAVP